MTEAAANGDAETGPDTNTSTSTSTWIGGSAASTPTTDANRNKLAQKTSDSFDRADIEPTRRRYLVLLLFCLHSTINGMQWIYLSSIASTVSDFFEVDNMAVNWTSMVFMLVYIPLCVPASWLFERIGMRNSILVGSLVTTLGSLIKCFNCRRGHFEFVLAGQTLVGVAQLFVLSVPPRLAAVWFPDHQVALANACGVFANQLGIALGFVAPQLVLGPSGMAPGAPSGDTQRGFFRLFLGVAGVSSLTSVLLMLLLDEAPEKPPGLARLQQIKQQEQAAAARATTPGSAASQVTAHENRIDFVSSLKTLARDANFVMLTVSYGLLVGVFYALSTVLNQMLAASEESSADAPTLAGRLGLVMVVSGMFGAIISGYILDRFHCYRLVNAGLYLLSLVSLVAFALALEFDQHTRLSYYLIMSLLGFFVTGYLLIGFEISNEITWPLPESVSAGLLNLAAQVFGVLLTYAGSLLSDLFGSAAANLFFVCFLLLGSLVNVMIKIQTKRQNVIHGCE